MIETENLKGFTKPIGTKVLRNMILGGRRRPVEINTKKLVSMKKLVREGGDS